MLMPDARSTLVTPPSGSCARTRPANRFSMPGCGATRQARRREQVEGRALRLDPAVAQQQHAARERERLAHVVRDVERRASSTRRARAAGRAGSARAARRRPRRAARRAAAARGSVASARASATRCFSPPESVAGKRSSSGRSRGSRSRSRRPPRRPRAPKRTLARAVRWGKRHASCGTYPMRRASGGRRTPAALSSSTRPSSAMRPARRGAGPRSLRAATSCPSPTGP